MARSVADESSTQARGAPARSAGPGPPAGPVSSPVPSRDRGADAGETLLALRDISKSFGPVKALTDVTVDVPAGCVTALCGDNGAGKSVLIKTIAGLWRPDSGQILWQGAPVSLNAPRDAEELGIRTIYQDLALCNNLDVVQNMFLGHEPLRHRTLDEDVMESAARTTLADLGVSSVRSIRQPVGSLSGGQRQSVAVARAVMANAKLVIMDEPTAALGVTQTRVVLDLVKSLAARGVGVLLISHNLNDVFEVADRLAVLYLGRLVAAGPAEEFDRQSTVGYMTTGAGPR